MEEDPTKSMEKSEGGSNFKGKSRREQVNKGSEMRIEIYQTLIEIY